MRWSALIVALLAGTSANGNAQSGDIAASRVVGSVVVDGNLEEETWAGATPVNGFTMTHPVDGGVPSGRTVVRVLFDGAALYIGIEADGPLVTHLGRRDATLPGSDWFHVRIDSRHEHQMAFEFAVNPSGVKLDRIVTATDESDDSWDPLWTVRVKRSVSRWTAEMRIPLASLRYRRLDQTVWGISFVRVHAAAGETSEFPHSSRAERGGIAAYAHLTGLEGLPSQSLTEVTPHVVARPDPAAELSGRRLDYSAGLDLTRSIGRDATITATVIPDFGQVEADPEVVNLTAFELQFPEKRPFFVEDAELFRFAPSLNPNPLFYSRRVGAAPSARVSGTIVDYPSARVAIAERMVTRRGEVSTAVLHALTLGDDATFISENGSISRTEVAAPSNFLAARVQTVNDGGRRVGGLMATAFLRSRSQTLDAFQRRSAGAFGADFRTELANRVWSFSGYAVASTIAGSAASIGRAQRSSARYFQRPDAPHLRLSGSAGSMSGASAGVRIAREAGKHWLGSATASLVTPGFEINDTGLLRRADIASASIDVSYRAQPARRSIRETGIAGFATLSSNTGGEFLGVEAEVEGTIEFANRWETQLEIGIQGAGYDDRLTRGGPAVRRFGSVNVEYELGTDPRRKLSVAFEAQGKTGEMIRRGNLWLSATYRARPNLSVSLTPELNHEVNRAQYVTAVADEAAPSFGQRHVFMQTTEESFSLGVRSELVVTPALTLQAYARPFAASVSFREPSELRLAGRDALRVYGSELGAISLIGRSYTIDPDGSGSAPEFILGDPSFSTTSITSNVTARWEWRPGSTLFVVWQNASEREADRAIGGATAFRELTRLAPRNVFLVKLSWRLGALS